MTIAARLSNAAWIASSRPSYYAFSRALLETEYTQRQRLSKYLRNNSETSLGRASDFASIGTAEAYAKRLPITNYADCQSDFEAIGAGDLRRRTADPVTHFALTAGTGGPAKTIPYNTSLKHEFSAAVSSWIVESKRANPAAFQGPAYWSVSPALGHRRTSGGVPVGFEEDGSYLGSWQKVLIDNILAVPGRLANVTDDGLSRRATASLLLGQSGLRLVSVWHPSIFTLLCDWITENWDTVLNDLETGLYLPEADLRIPRHPSRAHFLRSTGPENPSRFWPRLCMISAWGDGAASGALNDLSKRFPGAEVQPKGIIATEAFVSIPFRGEFPLAISSHYFEFQLENGDVLPCWRLERGMRGSPVVTTAGGLYRYRIEDIVEVTGHMGATPCVRLQSKRGLVSDLVGEKLDEAFVSYTVAGLLREHGIESPFALLAPGTGTAVYTLFIEARLLGSSLAQDLDLRLSENVHYALARRLGQLEAARVVPVRRGSGEAYLKRMCSENGQRRGDVKPLALSTTDGWEAWLDQREQRCKAHATE